MIFTEGITLYHGSYALVETPDLAQCRAGKDFGRGFYLTVDPDQAKRFVRTSVNKAVAEGRIAAQPACGYVSCFEVASAAGLQCKEFPEADEEWLQCVAAHRMGRGKAMGAWATYDVMVGKIANDNTNVVIDAYLQGLFGEAGSSAAMHIAIGRLIPERLKEQVCLRTQKALDCIRFCEGQEVAL